MINLACCIVTFQNQVHAIPWWNPLAAAVAAATQMNLFAHNCWHN